MSQHSDESQFPPVPEAGPPPCPPIHPVTPTMVLALRQTRPWVLFLAILGFVFAGLAIVGGLVMAAVMGFAGSFAGAAGGLGAGMGAAMGVGLGALYLLMGVLYFFPSLYLLRYATGIASMMQRDPVGGMESALRAQKSFWKFVGIAAIATMCLYVVIILAVVLFAGLAAARSMPGI